MPIREVFEVCDSSMIHHDVVEAVRAAMPQEAPLYDVSELFKVLGDATRAKILCALTLSEMCVGDIAAMLGMTSSAISHQLRTLKRARVVKSRRGGKAVYYQLADEHIKSLFQIAFEHATEG